MGGRPPLLPNLTARAPRVPQVMLGTIDPSSPSMMRVPNYLFEIWCRGGGRASVLPARSAPGIAQADPWTMAYGTP
eukprot:1404036-Prymnesium_polylepis.1